MGHGNDDDVPEELEEELRLGGPRLEELEKLGEEQHGCFLAGITMGPALGELRLYWHDLCLRAAALATGRRPLGESVRPRIFARVHRASSAGTQWCICSEQPAGERATGDASWEAPLERCCIRKPATRGDCVCHKRGQRSAAGKNTNIVARAGRR
ncbi:hypothetical protein IscW_ISCW017178 [Ixodes scapularis]|uniref:Uncharacterized protein n=1 Tax=Ixodes scapularis TaxID=6945 RepID=B7PAC6_IXOSC|nr:hypothetical protein IscW_ISCW017178 [Ixodes scapularis]|eukprot:XP_002406723.1 hypothetical protein IscW_ISCW017178 [Ixodes scapularis]